MNKVRAQMRDVFQKLFGMPDRDVVEEHEVLMNLAHVADVRNDGDAELFREQADRNKFADAAEARAVGLEKTDATGLQIVLEDDPVRDMLAQRKGERGDGICEGPMGEYVVGVSGFFDPQRAEGSEFFAGDEGLWEGPLLICVEHDGGLIACYFAKALGTR